MLFDIRNPVLQIATIFILNFHVFIAIKYWLKIQPQFCQYSLCIDFWELTCENRKQLATC